MYLRFDIASVDALAFTATQLALYVGMGVGHEKHQQPWHLRRSSVAIGDGVWIGAHAVILPGVPIGNGSVVAALVTKGIPPMEIWAGVPARRLSVRKTNEAAPGPIAAAVDAAVGSAPRC
jgi:acetyltransferase-like isoleucine patch superfamily enzyme